MCGKLIKVEKGSISRDKWFKREEAKLGCQVYDKEKYELVSENIYGK